MMNHNDHNFFAAPGFTFVEVLVALAIFGFASMALIKLASGQRAIARRAHHAEQALKQAQNMLAKAHLNHWYEKQEDRSQTDTSGLYTRRYICKAIKDKRFGGKGSLLRETITVDWPSDDQEGHVRLVNFLAQSIESTAQKGKP